MPRTRWTTEEQYTWLHDRIPEWRQAQDDGKVSTFLTSLVQKWYKKYPPPATPKKYLDKANGNEDKAKILYRDYWIKRLRDWYGNNGKVAAAVTTTTATAAVTTSATELTQADTADGAVLDFTKGKRKRLLYQAYLLLFAKRLNPLLRDMYEKEKKETPPGKKPIAWLAFQTAESMKLLAKEPPKIQNIVQRFRNGEFGSSPPELPDVIDDDFELDTENAKQMSQQRLRNLENLPRTLRVMFENMFEQTGWSGTILLAGPNPVNGRVAFMRQVTKIYTYLTWPQAMGPAFETDVQDLFVKYMETCFIQAAEETSRDPSEAPPDKQDAAMTEDLEHQRENQEQRPETHDGASDVEPLQTLDFDEQRDQNIQKVKELLQRSGLADAAKELLRPRASKQATSASKQSQRSASDPSGQQPPRPSQKPRAVSAVSTSPTPANGHGTRSSTSLHVAPHVPGKLQSSTSTDVAQPNPLSTEKTTTLNAHTPGSTSSDARKDVDGGEPAPSEPAAPTSNVPVPADPTPDASGGKSTLSEPNDDAPALPAPISLGGVLTAMTTTPERDGNPEPVRANGSDHMIEISSAEGMGKGKGSEEHDPMDIDDPDNQRTRWMDALGLKEDTRALPTDLPAWMEPLVEYFRDVSSYPAWQELIDEWIRFEERLSFPGSSSRMTTEHRPYEIFEWMQKGRPLDAMPVMPDKSIQMFKAWWFVLQPEWRQGDGTPGNTWPISDDLPDAVNDWGSLRHGGSNGVFLSLIALSWWYKTALDKDPSDADSRSAVVGPMQAIQDMTFVFGQVGTAADSTAGQPAPRLKRGRSTSKPSSRAGVRNKPPSKRARTD
ncbi:hypothetical protein EUX98_g8915 [Antrodiella citrinella]|uniref:Uncharacterized protein n=1 Tax=Antrodiella citrinella TaxID=2447956 RepID=A0A4S4M2F0_9APHY|nr:hypothetical protein EUX98_g8915 [Antrodiella citrinella]